MNVETATTHRRRPLERQSLSHGMGFHTKNVTIIYEKVSVREEKKSDWMFSKALL